MEMTVQTIGSCLGSADKTIRKIVDSIEGLGAQASGIMRERDTVDALIIETTAGLAEAAVKRDEGKLAELSGQLRSQLEHRAKLTTAFEATLEGSREQLQPFSEVANAALCVVPALKTIEANMAVMPADVIRALYGAANKVKFGD